MGLGIVYIEVGLVQDLLALFQQMAASRIVNQPLSFEFDEGSSTPRVVFVTDLASKTPATLYSQLSSITLTPTERNIIEHTKQQAEQQNSAFYNGDHLMITGMHASHPDVGERMILYVEAKRVSYAFLLAMEFKRFAKDSHLYHLPHYSTGVMAPFITTDCYTAFVQRAKDGNYSSAGGFLEPLGPQRILNFPETSEDLVVQTATAEMIEEFFGDVDSGVLRTSFATPKLRGISLRKSSGLSCIEFITPVEVYCSKEELLHIVKTNNARDRFEHTQKTVSVPLAISRRKDLLSYFKNSPNHYPGDFLQHPMLLSAALQVSQLDIGFQTPPFRFFSGK